MTRLFYLAVSVLIATVHPIGSSAQDDSRRSEINEYIGGLQHLDQTEVKDFTQLTTKTTAEGGIECTEEVIEGAPGFSTFMFTQSNADVMYPGSLLNGPSVKDKSYTPCSLQPGPLTVTVNLHSVVGDISRTIQTPSFSTVQSAIHDILSQEIAGDAGAEVSWSVDRVYSKEDLKSKIGMDFNVGDLLGGKTSLSVDFSSDSNKAIVQFGQKYYDIVIDTPRSPADYLNPSVDIDATKKALGQVSPMYISSVDYGRYVLFVFESTDLTFDLDHNLSASFSVPAESGVVKVGGNSQVEAGFKSGTLSCRAYILGGSGETACAAINGVDALYEYINSGGRYSRESPGRAISYTLRYLSDNYPVQVVEATEYVKRQCRESFRSYRITAVSFDLKKIIGSAPKKIDLFGWLSVKASTGESGILWHKKYVHQYPVRVGGTQSIGRSVNVSFADLSSAQLKNAYIDIALTVNGRWGLISEEFNPRSKRLYLRDLECGRHAEFIKTQWHELQVVYTVEGIE